MGFKGVYIHGHGFVMLRKMIKGINLGSSKLFKNYFYVLFSSYFFKIFMVVSDVCNPESMKDMKSKKTHFPHGQLAMQLTKQDCIFHWSKWSCT